MENKLCIHCSQKPPCPFQDGIFCRTTPCVRDEQGSTASGGGFGAGTEDFLRQFGNMFGAKK